MGKTTKNEESMANDNSRETKEDLKHSEMEKAPDEDNKLKTVNWSWRHWLCIVLFSVLCYWRDLDGAWILDDKGTITMNPVVVGDATPFLTELWNRDFWGHDALNDPNSHKSWRPLCTATYRINYILATKYYPNNQNNSTSTTNHPTMTDGSDGELKEEEEEERTIPSYWFHVVDRILHGLATGLCYIVASYCFINTTSPKSNNPTIHDSSSSSSSLWVAILFAVHPIHVESVANSTGRAEVLCALFYFSGFVAFASSCYHNIPFITPIGAVLFMTWASMLCKEHGITLPLLCIIWDVFLFTQTNLCELLQYLCNTSIRTKSYNRWKDCRQLIIRSISLLIGTGLLAWWRLSKNGPGSKADFVCEQNPVACHQNAITRFVHYSYLWCFNFYLMLFPEWLCPDWSGDSIPILASPYVTDPRFPACILLWFTLVYFLYYAIQIAIFPSQKQHPKSKIAITSMCWMLLPFLMSSNLLIYVGFVVADRILYLPSFGFCMLFVQTVDHFVSLHNNNNNNNNNNPSSIQTDNAANDKTTIQSVDPNDEPSEKNYKASNNNNDKTKRIFKIFTLSVVCLFYILKQQAQTKRWSDPVLLWGEGYRINPNSCITGKEYGMALVNANRGKDAVPILQSNHIREIHGKWFVRHISDRFKESTSPHEEKINEWTRMASVLQTRFKLVTAMGNSGSCVDARSIIEEGLSWAADILDGINKEKAIDHSQENKKYSLDQLEKQISLMKSFLLVSKSRCAENAAIMGKAALDAVMLVPGNAYVKNHAIRMNNLLAQINQQKISPDKVLLDWKQNPDGQTASLVYHQRFD